ncbi:MAG: ribosomal-processing cysteine protease Prp [Methanobrevibacter sp.]|nr:ribosomal-processing cysteine protease Prp [Methanobrevibacter sp.]
MVEVRCNYINAMGKTKKDYFIYTDIEVKGHADGLDMPHTTGIKVCAGISAICYGVRRLLDDSQFNVEIKKGYFHCWTNRVIDLKQALDRDSVYALNTLVCQLYELYCAYPTSFKSFDLVDVKEIIEDEKRKRNEQQWGGYEQRKPRKRNMQGMGIYSIIKGTHLE